MISEEYNYTIYSKETKKFIKYLSMPTVEDALLNIDKVSENLVYGVYPESSMFDGENIIEIEEEK